MEKPTWIIHAVIDQGLEYKDKFPDKDLSYLGNFHTHGLKQYDHRDLCLVLNFPEKIAAGLLNSMGMRIAENETVFTEGIRTDILENGMDVQLMVFDGDSTLYVILPDQNGKLPSDDTCEVPYKYQYDYAKILSENGSYV